jgi:acyl-CoA dehydrogenase
MLVVVMGLIGILSILGLLIIRSSWSSYLLFGSIIIFTLQTTKIVSMSNSLLLWLLIVVGIIFSIDNIRLKFISSKILQLIKHKLDLINNRLFIEPWIEANILCGELSTEQLLCDPQYLLTQEEQAFLDNQVEKLCLMLNSNKIFQNNLIPSNIEKYLKQNKFFAITIPVEFGGKGFSFNAVFEIAQKIASYNINIAALLIESNAIGFTKLLTNYGANLQIKDFLPKLVTGEYILSLSSNFNSDQIKNTGTICYKKYRNNKEILGVNLNLEHNQVIVKNQLANLLIVCIDLYDPNDYLCLNKPYLGKNICLVPNFNDKTVFIPLNFIIGSKYLFGQNYNEMRHCLLAGKDLICLSLRIAISKLCFKNIILNNKAKRTESLNNNFAKLYGYNYMLDAVRDLILTAINIKKGSSAFIIMAKSNINLISNEIINVAINIYGSNVMLGIKNHVSISYQNILMDPKFNNDIEACRALNDIHPLLSVELDAVKEEDIELFDYYLFSHVSFALSNLAKLIFCVITNKLLFKFYNYKNLNKYYIDLSFYNLLLINLIEFNCLFLKKNKQFNTRLLNIFHSLVKGYSIIRYFNKNQNNQIQNNLYLANWALQQCLYDIEQYIVELFQNLPNKLLGKIMQILIFPCGKLYQKPDDHLEQLICPVM